MRNVRCRRARRLDADTGIEDLRLADLRSLWDRKHFDSRQEAAAAVPYSSCGSLDEC